MAKYVSVDLDEISKAEEQFGRRVRTPVIKIKPGETKMLRVIKPPTSRTFFIVRVQHWGIPIGVQKTPPQTCNYKHFNSPCYFCEVTSEYYDSGDPRKAQIGGRIKANTSYISQVIDLSDPTNDDGTPKVQIWQYSETIWNDLKYYVKNKEDYGDIFHPKTGRDIRLTSELVGNSGGNTYTKHKIKVRGKDSAVPDKAVYDHLLDLEKERQINEFTYEQQKGIFDGTLDFRKGTPKALPGNGHGIPKLVESTSSDGFDDDDEFESAATSEVDDDGFDDKSGGIPASMEEPASEKVAESNEVDDDDDWNDVMSDDEDDEKVADMKSKLKAALNKKK